MVSGNSAILDDVSGAIAVHGYWPYLIGGLVVAVIIVTAAAYTFMKRKKTPIISETP